MYDAPVESMTSGQVAAALRLSISTVHRIPRDQLPYGLTPRGHRRYLLRDVRAYAVTVELTERVEDWERGGER
jgi:aminoglycoside phosphotransferase (APT) family kinase protein